MGGKGGQEHQSEDEEEEIALQDVDPQSIMMEEFE
jgi:hypothetical protein